MEEEKRFEITLDRVDAFTFDADFGLPGVPKLRMDEPAPLGDGDGPNAARVLAAAIGNCLSASALFCLERARVPVHGMHTTASGTMVRNEKGRMRIGSISVRIEPEVDPADVPRMQRCLEIFEDYCVVTQSVRGGIDVNVEVDVRERTVA
jgi:organic hydroperoxide reductase OsmC/OhrA